MGKSITPNASLSLTLSARVSASAHPFERGDLDWQLFQSAAHALQRRRLHGFDALEILKRLIDAGARDDNHAVAVADHHIARGDSHAAADGLHAEPTRSTPWRRIWLAAHAESPQ